MKSLRIQLFQHVPFEGPGSLEKWALERGHTMSRTDFFSGAPLPHIDDLDWLVIMGGPMGVSDEAAYPWLASEKRFISEAIETRKTVVGICLGAQLIASVLGARVYPNAHKEIGWYPLSLTPQGENDPACATLQGCPTVFHWHGDTFDLPREAVHLAYTDACRHQAFRYGNQVLGLQFHLEMETASLTRMLRHGKGELSERGACIQTAAEIADHPELLAENRERLFGLLDSLTGQEG